VVVRGRRSTRAEEVRRGPDRSVANVVDVERELRRTAREDAAGADRGEEGDGGRGGGRAPNQLRA
jgi:hypothetical protein